MKHPSLCPGARDLGAAGLVPVTILLATLCAAGTLHAIQAFGIILLIQTLTFDLGVQPGETLSMF